MLRQQEVPIRTLRWSCILLFSIGLIGCAGASAAGMMGMFVALAMSGLMLVACGSGSAGDGDADTAIGTDIGAVTDAVADADTVMVTTLSDADVVTVPDVVADTDADSEGVWFPCCENGVIVDCYCESEAICNYWGFNDCGDGTCTYDESEPCPGTTDVSDAASPPDTPVVTDTSVVTDTGPVECDGNWETCCDNGVVSTCCCPEGVACNYGWMEDCGDGTCVYPPETCMEPEPDVVEAPDVVTAPDVVEIDAGPAACDGTWQTCCVDGELGQCCCPEGVACNYWYEPCPDGGCTFPGEPCAEPEPQCDGAWESCCVDGVVDQCCCPEGVACNYGDFNDCGDGSCVGPMDMCAEPEPECDGTWESCCVSGLVDQCCCPDGMACNYGQYNDCGDGTCVGPIEECKASE